MNTDLIHSAEVKKGLIKILMFTLYSDEKTIYREYVQNALDSINEAVDKGILKEGKDGRVLINIDVDRKEVTIRDNGIGIDCTNAVRTLLDISASNKNGISQAGQFGIGRLAGGGYCHKLTFRTSAVGEDKGTKVTFDVDRIWEMVNEDSEDYPAAEVINNCTSREQIPADWGEHYFEVILEGVKMETAPDLLDKKKIVDYLCEVAPVEYKSEFNNVLVYKSIKMKPEFNVLHEKVEKVQVFVNQTRIQKQYGLSIIGTKDKIENLEYFKIEDKNYGMLGWGWYALTKFSIQIPSTDSLACIRLRKHNIQIGGSDQLSGYWKEPRGNSYFYGEFFVTHPNIVPNTARDGLAPTPESNVLIKKLKEYFESLKTLYHKANEAKTSIDKINNGCEKIRQCGNCDTQTKDSVENKGIGKFDKLMKSGTTDVVRRMLDLYVPDYEKSKSDYEKLRSAANINKPIAKPQQPQGLEKSENKDDTKENKTINGLNNPIGYDGNDNKESSIKANTSNDKLIAQQDPLESLNGKLNKKEIFLLRKVFSVLNRFCPNDSHSQELVKNMKKLIVKEFDND